MQTSQEQETEIALLKARIQEEEERAAPELLKASTQVRATTVPPSTSTYTTNTNTNKAALKQENDNIKRENSLMATAFFDLSSRLQMNNVSLQRRSEVPRSFLNKQRALVNQATAVRAK